MKTKPLIHPGRPRQAARCLTRRQFVTKTSSVAALSAVAPAMLRGVGTVPAKSTVAIVKGQDGARMVAEVLELLGGPGRFVKDGQKVILKPNCVYQPEMKAEWQPGQPIKITPAFTTHVELVEALVRQLQKTAKCSLTIAEGTPVSASRTFEYLGYNDMAKRNNVNLVDVDASSRKAFRVSESVANESYDLPPATRNCDVFIDLPVLKAHHVCGMSVGMKNLFGLLPMPKKDFHKKLNGVLCDLVKATRPALTLVDALYGMEGQGPLQGRPVKMDLLVAGTDIVAVDAVCAALMGFNPLAVEYLVLASQEGLGNVDLNQIAIVGTPLAKVRRQFEHAKWHVGMEIEQTESAVKTINNLAENKWEEREGQSLRFAPELLMVNSVKYPQRTSFGFTAWYRPGEKVIVFEAPYETLLHANRTAAEEELRQWLKSNIGQDVEPRMLADF